jgi:hypothetical protein
MASFCRPSLRRHELHGPTRAIRLLASVAVVLEGARDLAVAGVDGDVVADDLSLICVTERSTLSGVTSELFDRNGVWRKLLDSRSGPGSFRMPVASLAPRAGFFVWVLAAARKVELHFALTGSPAEQGRHMRRSEFALCVLDQGVEGVEVGDAVAGGLAHATLAGESAVALVEVDDVSTWNHTELTVA